ncbi:MAG TPA: metal-sensitive transcriptional regulator [Planctomycetaceae bacterium]
MLTDDEKRGLAARLRRVEGQVAGVRRMIEEGEYCVDILLQIAAARAALGRVGRLVLESHVGSCVRHAMANGDDADREQKLKELLDVFEQYADLKRK